MNIDKLQSATEFNEILDDPVRIKEKCASLEQYENIIQNLEDVMTFKQLSNAIYLLKDDIGNYKFKNKLYDMILQLSIINDSSQEINNIINYQLSNMSSNIKEMNSYICDLEHRIMFLEDYIHHMIDASKV